MIINNIFKTVFVWQPGTPPPPPATPDVPYISSKGVLFRATKSGPPLIFTPEIGGALKKEETMHTLTRNNTEWGGGGGGCQKMGPGTQNPRVAVRKLKIVIRWQFVNKRVFSDSGEKGGLF